LSRGYPLPAEIREDLKSVEQALASILKAESSRLSEAASLIVKAGGKRLRPALVLISGRVGDYDFEELLPAALTVELIHMASLIHDDILDEATVRRGYPTINSLWNRETAIAVGDYVFGMAFVYLSELGNSQIIDVMAEASESLSQGEWLELSLAFDPDQTIEDYMLRIRKKTAALFSACCLAGGLLSGAQAQEVEALKEFGENLGIAFQIRDDLLDLWGDENTLGKPVGSDLREGIATLPFFYAVKRNCGNGFLRSVISSRDNSEAQIQEAIAIMSASGAREESERVAKEYLENALTALSNISRQAVRTELSEVARFVLERHF
jgi:heptaprenyl diphosphate synthase